MAFQVLIEPSSDFERIFSANGADILSSILDDMIKFVYDFIMQAGQGVRGGMTPSGGAPVDTGALIDSHELVNTDKLSKTIVNTRDYAVYVVNGTSHIPPNDYPTRAIEALYNSSEIEFYVERAMSNI